MTESSKLPVESAMQSWAEAFSAERPDSILALYAEDAVLWGTLPPTRRDDPAALRDYFEQVFTFTNRKVTFKDPLIRIYNDMAINTGYYTFFWIRDGQSETTPSRYSMTYAKRNGRWQIVDHHSSILPVPTVNQ